MHADTCSITGLTTPECSCDECIRQLLARFGPAEAQTALAAATDAYEAEVEAAIGVPDAAAPSGAAESLVAAGPALVATELPALATAGSSDALSVAERLMRPAL